jgi:hypothetical protein
VFDVNTTEIVAAGEDFSQSLADIFFGVSFVGSEKDAASGFR